MSGWGATGEAFNAPMMAKLKKLKEEKEKLGKENQTLSEEIISFSIEFVLLLIFCGSSLLTYSMFKKLFAKYE